MSLIKLALDATTPSIMVVNKDGSSGTTKSLTAKNMIVAGAGGLGAFSGNELGERYLKINKSLTKGRLANRMLGTAGGFLAAGLTYKALNRKNKDNNQPNVYFL